jgi:GH24 family phage-related lysozyme (muramidase)
MAGFKDDLKENVKTGLRDAIETKTGIIGKTLRYRRKRAARLEQIDERSNELRSINSSTRQLEVSFIQISKNLQALAKTLGAAVVVQKEELAMLQKEALTTPDPVKREQDKAELAQKVVAETEGSSLFDNLLDMLDGINKKAKKIKKPPSIQERAKQKAKADAERAKQKAKADAERAKIESKAAKEKVLAEEKARAAGKSAKDVQKAGKDAAKKAVKKASAAQIKSIATKALMKSIGKIALKSIPFIGVAAGTYFAVEALMRGDTTSAGLEVASSLAGPLTAIPLTLAQVFAGVYFESYGISYAEDFLQDPEGANQRADEVRRVIQETAKEMLTDRVVPRRPDQVKVKAQDVSKANLTPAQAKNILDNGSKGDIEAFGGRARLESIAAGQGAVPVPPPPALQVAQQAAVTPIPPVTSATVPVAPKPTPIAPPPVSGTGLKMGGGEGLKMPSGGGDDASIMAMIKKHEGFKNKPYQDSRDRWTVGVGHLIGNGKTLPPEWNRTFSDEEVNALFAKDFAHHKELASKAPGWDLANASGRAALIDLTFNMGLGWVNKFKKGTEALRKGDFKTAADEFVDSAWFKQVKGRAVTVTGLLREGAKGGGVMTNTSPATGAQVSQASTEVAASKPKQQNNVTVIAINDRIDQRVATPSKNRVELTQRVGG